MCRIAAPIALLVASSVQCARGGEERVGCRPAYKVPPREAGVAYLDFIAVGDTGTGDGRRASAAAAMAGYALASPSISCCSSATTSTRVA